jgi:arsenate reductase
MAQAFFNYYLSEFPTIASKYRAISVGTMLGDRVNPTVIEAMAEIGIDLSDSSVFYPKSMNSDFIESKKTAIRKVIVACDDTCELTPEVKAIPEHWSLPDPNGKSIEEVRKVRDLVKKRVLRLMAGLARG